MTVITILEAHVAPENWISLQKAFNAGSLPPQLVESFLAHSTTEPTLWRIISVWRSREALEEMRRSTQTPAGVLMFREAKAEPTLSVFDVAVHLSRPQKAENR